MRDAVCPTHFGKPFAQFRCIGKWTRRKALAGGSGTGYLTYGAGIRRSLAGVFKRSNLIPTAKAAEGSDRDPHDDLDWHRTEATNTEHGLLGLREGKHGTRLEWNSSGGG